jgi:hypothetical protein
VVVAERVEARHGRGGQGNAGLGREMAHVMHSPHATKGEAQAQAAL